MCIDKDLFGDVIVTFDDVELWLDKVPVHLSDLPRSRLNYIKNYDVANKIKAAKLNGFFYTLEGAKNIQFTSAEVFFANRQ